MTDLEKLTDTCYISKDTGLAIVRPVDRTEWVVIDSGTEENLSGVVFGPAQFERCKVYVAVRTEVNRV